MRAYYDIYIYICVCGTRGIIRVNLFHDPFFFLASPRPQWLGN